MEGKELFLEALNFRHACKIFDKNRSISTEDTEFILECGRLSPTSFGLEQFRFLIVESPAKKEELKKACWNQDQISDAPLVVAFKTKVKDMYADSEYVLSQFSRKGREKEFLEAYLSRYKGFLEGKNIPCWSEKQAYIAAGVMMSAAASIGIDSCPIEGFEKERAEGILGICGGVDTLSLIVAFGYRVKPQTKRYRLPLDTYIEKI